MKHIEVEIMVSAWGSYYDFSVHPDMSAESFINKAWDMIMKKEHWALRKEEGQFIVAITSQKRFLDFSQSLYEQGILSGEQLILL